METWSLVAGGAAILLCGVATFLEKTRGDVHHAVAIVAMLASVGFALADRRYASHGAAFGAALVPTGLLFSFDALRAGPARLLPGLCGMVGLSTTVLFWAGLALVMGALQIRASRQGEDDEDLELYASAVFLVVMLVAVGARWALGLHWLEGTAT